MSATKVKTIDDLPELPFEQILSHLTLEDRLKSKAVSRTWYQKINGGKVRRLCYSMRPSGFIERKGRWLNGAFVRNLISSARFESFFNTYARSLLLDLKHLRICEFDLDQVNESAFSRALNSFDQLEQLDIIRFSQREITNQLRQFTLTLPMLTSLQLENFEGILKLTLDAPRLRKVQFGYCTGLSVDIVHGESVERLLAYWLKYIEVKNLKNLKTIYTGYSSIDPTLLAGLEQLKAVSVYDRQSIEKLFEQKQRYGRTDLKIYLRGILLAGPADAAIDSLSPFLNEEAFFRLAEDPSRLADEIPFHSSLGYSTIERMDQEVAIDLVGRFSNLDTIYVTETVRDVERFLKILKRFPGISTLEFLREQPQDLFDRLPEHCAIQKLIIYREIPDLHFLCRLGHLVHLELRYSMDIALVRRLLEELPYLCHFAFRINYKEISIEISFDRPKRFDVSVAANRTNTPDLEAAIKFIEENALQPEYQCIKSNPSLLVQEVVPQLLLFPR